MNTGKEKDPFPGCENVQWLFVNVFPSITYVAETADRRPQYRGS
jgi:hypothetical protein